MSTHPELPFRPSVVPGPLPTAPRFDGETYVPTLDRIRLTGQMWRVWTVMADGVWRTLPEIAAATGAQDSEAGISARLRDYRKRRFGDHDVQRRHRGEAERGLYEYRLVPHPGITVEEQS